MIAATSSARHTAYVVAVVAHVIAAVVGFGSVAMSGVYASNVRHLDRPGVMEEARRYFASRGWASYAIVAVPFFGAAALGLGRHYGGFGQLWVVAGLVVWFAAAAILLGVLRPATARIRVLLPAVDVAAAAGGEGDAALAADPGDGDELNRSGRRLSWGAAACDVLFAVALVLMIVRPG